MQGPTEFRFGTFRLLPGHRQLFDSGAPVKLGARAYDMLLTLIEHRHRPVSKRELMDRVWRNLVVEENNLQVQIVALRKVLGPAAIATIPGRGYQFTLSTEVAEPASTNAAGDATVRKGNLPEHPPLLYGRAADVAAVRSLLDQEGLVSIVGAAGMGKTRLAQLVAHTLRDTFQEGVWFVDFAPLSDPSLVTAHAMRTLGLNAGESRESIERLLETLAGHRSLLVLDNCEHLLDPIDAFVAVLRSRAPKVRILVTSQEVLRQPDEHVYRLGGLPLPVDATVPTALDAGAVELFVARTQAVDIGFLLRDDNVGSVIEICRRLDGIPLAIELAAARVSLLGVDRVRERLDERFRLLTAGSRIALRRHQTLRAALEWSYSLLSEPEQVLFEQLGVFAGSFSLECAQRLAADDAMDEWAVLDHLGALVDKSLVNVDATGTARYRMLETMRSFALERLAARSGTSYATHRHAEVILEVFERAQLELTKGTPSATLVDVLAPELDNFRSALRWAAEPGGDRRIAVALFGAAIAGHAFFHRITLRLEARRWSEIVERLVDDSIPAADAARFWLACAQWRSWNAPFAAAQGARRAVALYCDLDDEVGMLQAFGVLAVALARAGRGDDAMRALEESFARRNAGVPLWILAVNDNIAAIVLSSQGRFGEARAHALAWLAASRKKGIPIEEWHARSFVVDFDVGEGNTEQAADAASELLTSRAKSIDELETGMHLRLLATALLSAGRLDEAETAFREALSRVQRNYEHSALVLYDLAMLIALRGHLDDAARVFGYAQNVAAVEGWQPRYVSLQLRDRLLAMLAAQRSPDALARLCDEGRQLTDVEACALAFRSSQATVWGSAEAPRQ